MTSKLPSKKLHVLHVTPSYYPATYWGGPIFSVYGLNNALANLPEVDLRVLTTDSAGRKLQERLDVKLLEEKKLYPGYEVIFTRRIFRNSTSLELLAKLPALIQWADVVHLTATYSFPTIPTMQICRILRKPLIWSPRGALLDAYNLSFSNNKIFKRLWNRIINSTLYPEKMILHATSKEEKDISTLQIPKIRAEIIHNGVDIPIHWTSNKAYLSNKLRLLYLGRLDPKKGLENLIDAMALLDNPQITLSIYGSGNSGYTSKLQNKVKQAGLCDGRVKFNGHVEGEAKDAAFRNADILILPSHSENFGMAIAEALAHGVPVIASRNTPWNGLEMKKCGLWVDNSPKSLVDAINSIRKMDLAEMSQNGRQWMKDEFSWDVIGNKIFNLYNEVTR